MLKGNLNVKSPYQLIDNASGIFSNNGRMKREQGDTKIIRKVILTFTRSQSQVI